MNELFFVNADNSVSRICGMVSIATDVSTESKCTDAASVVDLLDVTETLGDRLIPSRLSIVADALVSGEVQIAMQDQIALKKHSFVVGLADGVGDPTTANVSRSKLYFSGTIESLGHRLTEKGNVSVISCKVGNGQQRACIEDNFAKVAK